MPQNRNKLTTTRRNSGSFIYPDASGIGMTVGVASTAILSNSNDIFFRGIHHLKQPVEGLVHIVGQGGGGGNAAASGGGGGGGGGYLRAYIDSVNAKRFVATVTADSTPPTGFWFSAENYVAFSAGKGGTGSNGNNDQDGGRGFHAPGAGAGPAGSGNSSINAGNTLFRVLQMVNGTSGSGSGTVSGENSHHGGSGGGPGGSSGFRVAQPSHPLAVGPRGNGNNGTPGPSGSGPSQTNGYAIIESPGRPWNMINSGNPVGGYRLS